MEERKGLVTFGGHPVTLVGDVLQKGEKAPDFVVLNNDLQPTHLSDYAGKIVVLSAVASLDTGVCDTETRKFNEMAAGLGDNVEILTISMDLPFTQKRWCGAAGVDRVTTLSDSVSADFGTRYGVLMKEFRMLARTVFVVDSKGILRYVQLLPEVGTEPNYEEVLEAIKAVI